jgi:6-phosphogluconolactonase (cycloisomerase 2 family)
MFMRQLLWNRREFVQWMGCSSLGTVGLRTGWLSGAPATNSHATPLFAYVGYGDRSGQGIQVFAIRGERWTPTQSIASEHPSFLALHPNQRFLYAVNEIDSYHGLPSGSVEAFAIDPDHGGLALLNRQPLSLSAIRPRHLAVSPDGRNLVVAVSGGGAYNVLPIATDGRLGQVSGILKEVGSGPNPDHQQASHPQMVIFDPTSRHLLGTDLGSDRLNVFRLADDKLTPHGRSATQPGSGPHQIAFHPNSHLLYVRNELEGSISCYEYDAANGKVLDRLHHVAVLPDDSDGQRAVGTMAIHPSGNYLYVSDHRCDTVAGWRINTTTGALAPMESRIDGLGSPHAITLTPDGSALLVLSQKNDCVFRVAIDIPSGRLHQPVQVAKLPMTPKSLAVKYA